MTARPWILIVALLMVFTVGCDSSRASDRVVVTIPTLGFLVNMVDPSADVTVLIDGDEDPHHATLTPFERLALSRAGLIVTSAGLEGGMADALADPDLADRILPLGSGHAHFWFDFDQVSEQVRVLAYRMTGGLGRQETYNTLLELDTYGRDQLSDFKGAGIVALHAGLEPFVKRFGLSMVYEVTADHEAGLGAADFSKVVDLLSSQESVCLVADLHTPVSVINAIKRDAGGAAGVLQFDFAGGQYDSYDTMMRSLIDGLAACIQS